MTDAEHKRLIFIAADLLEVVRTCRRFPGSAKAGEACRETLFQYGACDRAGVLLEVDCYTLMEVAVNGDK